MIFEVPHSGLGVYSANWKTWGNSKFRGCLTIGRLNKPLTKNCQKQALFVWWYMKINYTVMNEDSTKHVMFSKCPQKRSIHQEVSRPQRSKWAQ